MKNNPLPRLDRSPDVRARLLPLCRLLNRRCFTVDVDPIYAEITIRRLEQFRATKRIGWQNGHAFENEIPNLAMAPSADMEDQLRYGQKALF